MVIGAFVRGLSMRDVESLSDQARLGKLSESTAARLCLELRERFEAFGRRDLYDIHLAALFLDATFLAVLGPARPHEGVLVASSFISTWVTCAFTGAEAHHVELGADFGVRLPPNSRWPSREIVVPRPIAQASHSARHQLSPRRRRSACRWCGQPPRAGGQHSPTPRKLPARDA